MGASERDDLVGHVVRTTQLETAVAARVVDDVVAFFRESTEEFVRRRHRELQTQGVANAEIFERVSAELTSRLVAPRPLSQRQIRRVVYG